MTARLEQFPAKNPNPVLSVAVDGTVLYSNTAGEPLLHEWCATVGEKLPSDIGDIVQKVISLNSPEKIEVKAGNRVYSVLFHPLPEEYVNIYGFDISCQKDEIQSLRARLEEPEELQRAISEGDLDGLVMPVSKEDLMVFTLNGADQAYRILMDTANEDVVIVDAEFRITYAGKRFINKIGSSQEEVIGKSLMHFVDREYKVFVEQRMEERKQGVSDSYEAKLICRDGSPYWAIVSVKPLIGNDGKFKGALAMLTDINERKHAEESMREAYGTLQALYEELQAQSEELQIQNEELHTQSDELHEAYEALNESEKRYRLLFDHSLDAIILTDPRDAGKILSVNPAACRMLGWSEDELIGKGRDVLFDQDDPTLSALLEERAHFGSAKVLLTYRRKDRTTFIGELSTTLFTDINGESRTVAIIRDITERKRAEEALRVSEERYKMLFTNMTEAFLLGEVICDKDGEPYDYTCLDANPAYEVNSGLKRETIIGKSIRELFTDANLMSIKRYGKVALSGQPTNFEFFSQALNRYLDVNVFSPEKGKFAVIFRDITERKRAEEELAAVHSQIQGIIDNTPDIVYAFDLEERFVLANIAVANVLNSTPDRMIGKRRHEFMPKMDADWHEANDRQVFEAGRALEFEEYSHLKGCSITWLTKKFPLRDAQGRIYAVAGISADITERKRAEEALSLSEEKFRTLSNTLKEKVKERTDELVGTYKVLQEIEIVRKQEIHHRIKNNLQVISSLLDLQAEKFRGKKNIEDSQILEAFKESQDRVISMALIHEELYKGKGFKGEGFEGEGFETLNFSLYIEKLAESLLLTYKLGNTDVSLNLDLDQNLYFEMDTAIPLGIIVNELVTNCLKHAFKEIDKGEIRIKLYRVEWENDNGTNFILTVSDNGIGISEDLDIENLESLGLQLVTTLVDQLDGELEIKRDNGTEFTIRFTITEKSDHSPAPNSHIIDMIN
jgi:PAS domain S-box-containing protein